jgi:hypothetical protein
VGWDGVHFHGREKEKKRRRRRHRPHSPLVLVRQLLSLSNLESREILLGDLCQGDIDREVESSYRAPALWPVSGRYKLMLSMKGNKQTNKKTMIYDILLIQKLLDLSNLKFLEQSRRANEC